MLLKLTIGRLFALFANVIFNFQFDLKQTNNRTDKEEYKILNTILKSFFNGFWTKNAFYQNTPNCNFAARNLLPNYFDTYLDLIKPSHVKTPLSATEKLDFVEKYINNATIFQTNLKSVEPKYLTEEMGIVPFCDVAPLYSFSNRLNDTISCKYFEPIVTPKGLCYSFNALTATEMFNNVKGIKEWTSTFSPEQNSNLINPFGYGQSHGLNFILNAFEPFPYLKSSKNFLLAITNEHNPYDIIKQNFVLTPGASYIYNIVASQITTSERFNAMSPLDRGCSLPTENFNSSLTKFYSTSGCVFECTIRHAYQKYNCTPWNMPNLFGKSAKICDWIFASRFENEMKTLAPAECNCPSECSGTSFSIFQSRMPLEVSKLDCADLERKAYPDYAFCTLCKATIKNYRIRFTYDYLVDNAIDPNNVTAFCQKFVAENVVQVKVEMATKSLTRCQHLFSSKLFQKAGPLCKLKSYFCNSLAFCRTVNIEKACDFSPRSIKDQKFNFVGQLSSLGKT